MSSDTRGMRPSMTRVWLAAARPRTLSAALAPVGLGAALAIGDGVFHAWSVIAALVGATLIQIGTNFANDYFDFVKGTDDESRIGPARATAEGWVSPRGMAVATVISFVAAAACGAYLVVRGGSAIAVVGALSIASGILYTGGPKPLGYIGLGDVFVLVFFGPVAVEGTYWVQARTLSHAALWLGFATGALATAILVVNNLRDREGDARSSKRTLVVRFGARFGRFEYAACFGLAAIATLVVLGAHPERPWLWIGLGFLVPAVFAVRAIAVTDGPALNPWLGRTAAIQLLHALLVGIAWCTA